MKITDEMWARFVAEFRDFRDDTLHGCRAAFEAALADVPEPSKHDNIEDFAGDLVCKYHGLDRGGGRYRELKTRMVEALLFVTRMRDGK